MQTLKQKNKREMSAYELTFPQVPQRRADGRFTKGFKPHNKGKKWSEWMSEEGQKKVLAVMKHYGNPSLAGWNKREVIMYNPKSDKWRPFESCAEAGRLTGILRRNINKCIDGQRNHAGGMWWFDARTNWPKAVEERKLKLKKL